MNIKGKIIRSGTILLSLGMLVACNTTKTNAVKVAENCNSRGPITIKEFNMLKEGQTWDQVNQVFGCSGMLRMGVVHGDGAYTGRWDGGPTSVTVIFVNGRLSSQGVQKYGF